MHEIFWIFFIRIIVSSFARIPLFFFLHDCPFWPHVQCYYNVGATYMSYMMYLFCYLCDLWPVAHPIIKMPSERLLVKIWSLNIIIIVIVIIIIVRPWCRRRHQCARLIAEYASNVNIVTTGRATAACNTICDCCGNTICSLLVSYRSLL